MKRVKTRIMGILNVTPDSFSDGGMHNAPDAALLHARRMAEEGADIIDIGGESTRPGSAPVNEAEEFRRVVPVVEAIRAELPSVTLSIDTRRSAVARRCLELGAEIINDVSSLESDSEMAGVVRDFNAHCVLMHGYGDPEKASMTDGVRGVVEYLRGRIEYAKGCGIAEDRLIADPGIGFNKNVEDNLAILHGLEAFKALPVPLLMAASRKRFIGALTGESDPLRRMEGSVAVVIWSVLHGAAMVRVHDVAETRRALAVAEAIAAGKAE